jgi:hypothetical protein
MAEDPEAVGRFPDASCHSRDGDSPMDVAAKIAGWLLLILIAPGVPFAWILRDGLGPDAVESAGFHAVSRTFWTFYVGPLIVLSLITWLVLFSTAKRREERAAGIKPAQEEG